MGKQNFAATAEYFERRARKSGREAQRSRLQHAAEHYRVKARQLGHRIAPEQTAFMPSRRRRLVELFRNYEAAAQPGGTESSGRT